MARRGEARPIFKFRAAAPTGNRTDGVFVGLKEAIVAGKLLPGTPLIEAHLAEAFNTSKTPVREALLRLSKEGLVSLTTARGASVQRLTNAQVKDIFQMRLHLEPLGLELGAEHLLATDLATLKKILTDAKLAIKQKDFSGLSRLNLRFHRGLYSKASNKLLVQWLDSLGEQRRLLSLEGWQHDNRSQREWQEHQSILVALEDGDVALAKRRLVQHIKNFSRLIDAHLKED